VPVEKSQVVERMIDKWLKQVNPPNTTHSCPECNGLMHVRFEVYTRRAKRMLGVQVWCDNCDMGIAIDYDGSRLPAWLRAASA